MHALINTHIYIHSAALKLLFPSSHADILSALCRCELADAPTHRNSLTHACSLSTLIPHVQVRHFEARLQEAQEHAAEYAACTAQLQQLQKLADAQALGLQDLETRAQELDARVRAASFFWCCSAIVPLQHTGKLFYKLCDQTVIDMNN